MGEAGAIASVTDWRVTCAGCCRVATSGAQAKGDAINHFRWLGWQRGWDDRWRCPACAGRYERDHAGESEADR